MHDQLIALLAGRRGHFQMESGYHTDQWFDLDRLFADRARLLPFAVELARRLSFHRVDAVCGPQTGGAQLAAMIAATLNVDAYAADRIEPPGATGFFPIKYSIPAAVREKLRHRRIALVDDAISAGSAIRGTHADLLACGAQPVALGALFIFGDAAAQFAARHSLALEGLARLPSSLWPPVECPLCRAGLAYVKVSDAAPP